MVIGVVLQSTAAIFGSVLILITTIRNGGTSSLEFDRAGLFWSCMAGLAVGLAKILSFCISGMGVNATQSISIIIGGSIVIGTVLGLLMLGETIMWSGWLGISFLVSGIWLVVIDPGQNSSTTKTERAMRSYCCFWKHTSRNHPSSATLHTEIDGTTGHTDSSVQLHRKWHHCWAWNYYLHLTLVQQSVVDGCDPSATMAIISSTSFNIAPTLFTSKECRSTIM